MSAYPRARPPIPATKYSACEVSGSVQVKGTTSMCAPWLRKRSGRNLALPPPAAEECACPRTGNSRRTDTYLPPSPSREHCPPRCHAHAAPPPFSPTAIMCAPARRRASPPLQYQILKEAAYRLSARKQNVVVFAECRQGVCSRSSRFGVACIRIAGIYRPRAGFSQQIARLPACSVARVTTIRLPNQRPIFHPAQLLAQRQRPHR